MRTPTGNATTTAVEPSQLYRMKRGSRLLLWGPRLLLLAVVAGGILEIVAIRTIWSYVLGAFFVIAGLLMMIVTRRQTAPVIVAADLEEKEIRFQRWDGRSVRVARRGRSLRKSSRQPSPAYLAIEVVDEKEISLLLKQDKDAVEMLADLERRGVVRGPGNAQDRFPTMPMPGGREAALKPRGGRGNRKAPVNPGEKR